MVPFCMKTTKAFRLLSIFFIEMNGVRQQVEYHRTLASIENYALIVKLNQPSRDAKRSPHHFSHILHILKMKMCV